MFEGRYQVAKALTFSDDGAKYLTRDEILAKSGEEEMEDLVNILNAIIVITDNDFLVGAKMDNFSEDELAEIKKEGMPIFEDLVIFDQKELKQENGQVLVFAYEEDGEKKFMPLKEEDGLLLYNEMLLLERI